MKKLASKELPLYILWLVHLPVTPIQLRSRPPRQSLYKQPVMLYSVVAYMYMTVYTC